jgi:arylformamidase
MKKIIDISVPIFPAMPVWPNTPNPRFSYLASLKDGDMADDTKIEMSVHSGTHIDAPRHFIARGQTIENMPLDIFIGQVFVAHMPEITEITASNLEKIKLPKNIDRILFKTSNSRLWQAAGGFRKEYVGLTASAASWLVKRGIKLVGIDYLSIAKFDQTVEVHRILLKKGIAILEGLNLAKVKEGKYELVCLPLKIKAVEAAPVRAILTS